MVHDTFSEAKEEACVGVHCIAGLGRAPILVAISLIDYGMANYEAIELIRKHRNDTFNTKQLNFVKEYKPVKPKNDSNCIIF